MVPLPFVNRARWRRRETAFPSPLLTPRYPDSAEGWGEGGGGGGQWDQVEPITEGSGRGWQIRSAPRDGVGWGGGQQQQSGPSRSRPSSPPLLGHPPRRSNRSAKTSHGLPQLGSITTTSPGWAGAALSKLWVTLGCEAGWANPPPKRRVCLLLLPGAKPPLLGAQRPVRNAQRAVPGCAQGARRCPKAPGSVARATPGSEPDRTRPDPTQASLLPLPHPCQPFPGGLGLGPGRGAGRAAAAVGRGAGPGAVIGSGQGAGRGRAGPGRGVGERRAGLRAGRAPRLSNPSLFAADVTRSCERPPRPGTMWV